METIKDKFMLEVEDSIAIKLFMELYKEFGDLISCCFQYDDKWGDCKIDLVKLCEINKSLHEELINKIKEDKE